MLHGHILINQINFFSISANQFHETESFFIS